MTRPRPTSIAFIASLASLGALVLSAAVPAHAAGGKARTPSLPELRSELASGDVSRVLRALEQLGQRKQTGSLEALSAFVRQGQPDAFTDHAITALGALASPNALPLLGELTRHRRPSARVAALSSLAGLPGAAVDALLLAGLRDSDATVRGTSAHLLGERGTKIAVATLFVALERGVPEAAPAIGQLGDGAAVARMHGLLGRLPLATMLSGYERFLARADLDEAIKVDIVARLGEVAGVTVKRFLEQQLAAGVAARAPQLAHALRETARRIDERPPAARGRTP